MDIYLLSNIQFSVMKRRDQSGKNKLKQRRKQHNSVFCFSSKSIVFFVDPLSLKKQYGIDGWA